MLYTINISSNNFLNMNIFQNMIPFGLVSPASSMVLVAGIFGTIFFVGIILIIVPMCLIFKKAERKWWEAIIPFYNIYILTIIVGVPWWILIGFFIPIINYVTSAVMYYYLSKRFGYEIPFAVGLFFLPFIFLPVLGYGDAIYTKPEKVSLPFMD